MPAFESAEGTDNLALKERRRDRYLDGRQSDWFCHLSKHVLDRRRRTAVGLCFRLPGFLIGTLCLHIGETIVLVLEMVSRADQRKTEQRDP